MDETVKTPPSFIPWTQTLAPLRREGNGNNILIETIQVDNNYVSVLKPFGISRITVIINIAASYYSNRMKFINRDVCHIY